MPWKPHPRNPLVLVLFAFADEVLGAGLDPPGSLREMGWKRVEEKEGERDRGRRKRRDRKEMERGEREG